MDEEFAHKAGNSGYQNGFPFVEASDVWKFGSYTFVFHFPDIYFGKRLAGRWGCATFPVGYPFRCHSRKSCHIFLKAARNGKTMEHSEHAIFQDTWIGWSNGMHVIPIAIAESNHTCGACGCTHVHVPLCLKEQYHEYIRLQKNWMKSIDRLVTIKWFEVELSRPLLAGVAIGWNCNFSVLSKSPSRLSRHGTGHDEYVPGKYNIRNGGRQTWDQKYGECINTRGFPCSDRLEERDIFPYAPHCCSCWCHGHTDGSRHVANDYFK